MARQSKSFGSERALKAHLVQASGGLAAEINDLRNDVEEGFQNNEGQLTFPAVDWLDASAGALLAAGGDVTIIGQNLLQGQTFDTLTIGTGNAAVTVTALKPGDTGFSLEVVQGAGALSAAFTNGALVVTLAAAGSSATLVTAAINALAGCIGVVRAVAGGSGASDVLVVAKTSLAGGSGYYAGNKVTVSGVEALPKHVATPWTNTSITVTVPALTGATPARAAGDVVSVVATSNGIVAAPLSGVLA